MKIRTVPCKVVMEHAMCDCGGEFYPTNPNICLTTYPPQYPHKCKCCGKLINLTKRYPSQNIEEVTDAE